VSGIGGNERHHKAFKRHLENPTSSANLTDTFMAMQKRVRDVGEIDRFQRALSSADSECSRNDWDGAILAGDMKKHAPNTVAYILGMEHASQITTETFCQGNRAEALKRISRLPWASTSTVRWFTELLCKTNEEPKQEVLFPLQVLGLLPLLPIFATEASDTIAKRASWTVADLIATQEHGNSGLCAIRFFMDRLKQAASLEAFDDFFDIAMKGTGSPETRRR